MSCPGLHCPGCTEGQSLAITSAAVLGLVLADETVQWVAERVFWIGGTLAVCLALSVAASMALEARADRRGAAFAAAHGILSRADVILPEVASAFHPPFHLSVSSDSARGEMQQAAETARPALGFRDLHIHLDGVPVADQAAVIRQALNGGNT